MALKACPEGVEVHCLPATPWSVPAVEARPEDPEACPRITNLPPQRGDVRDTQPGLVRHHNTSSARKVLRQILDDPLFLCSVHSDLQLVGTPSGRLSPRFLR